MASGPNRWFLPLAAGLVVCVVGADVVRRALMPAAPPPAGDSRSAASDTTTMGGGAATPATAADSAADAGARARTRDRIAAEAPYTYLAEIVRDADSTIRRWSDERIQRPLKVVVIRQTVDGFQEDFVSNVGWALGRWDGVIPVPLESGTDSATADIVIVWTAQLDSNRAGRTDLSWDRRGWIRRALVVLATHGPDGRPLDSRRMSSLALHEIGHAIGLNHSPNRDDVLHPVAYAMELSERDRRTARVLYELPPGPIR